MRSLILAVAASMALAGPCDAQGSLGEAAEAARRAWMEHRADLLSPGPDRVILALPGTDLAAPLDYRQAARVLGHFLGDAVEVDLVYRTTRQVDGSTGFADALRRYRPRGTQEELVQRLFFGFRRIEGEWRIREIRITDG